MYNAGTGCDMHLGKRERHMARLPGASVILLALCCSGCFHHHLLTYGQAGNVSQFHRTVNAGWAGHRPVAPPPGAPDSETCNNQIDRNGMHMVTVNSNLGYSVLTVVTLGAFAPLGVQWSCAPNPSVIGPTPSMAGAGRSAPVTAPSATGSTSRTLTSWVWGALQTDAKAPANPPPNGAAPQGPPTPANCNDKGMGQAKAGLSPANYFYSLLTVGTAGLVAPWELSWQCKDANGSH